MDQLDFAALQRIREAVAQIDTTDLVGVWSAGAGEQLLFIYNAERTPDVAALPGQPITLKALADHDPSRFDGLLVGIPAIELVRPNPLTKGPRFYPLERLMADLGQQSLLHRNLYRLAQTLLAWAPGLSDDSVRHNRFQRKALQLALPYLVEEHGADELVAIAPGKALEAFIDGQQGCWLRAGDDLRLLSTLGPEDWIVALEELDWLSAAITLESGRFVPLRRAFLPTSQNTILKRTRAALAKRFSTLAAASSQAHLAAYQLMVEYWLDDEDAEDLVAIFPHIDFTRFAESGDALRVYRSLKGFANDTTAGPNWDFAALSNTTLPDVYQSYGFALIPLHRIPGLSINRAQAADLGPLLRQANHDTALAQTMLMLAHDMVESRSAETIGAPAEIVSDLAQRAWIFISLGDPWLWRHGRYGQLLDSAAAILKNALLYQAKTTDEVERDYHLALIDWYCAGEGENIEDRLRRMGEKLRAFQHKARESSRSTQARIETAQRLLEIERVVLYPDAGSQLDQGSAAGTQPALAPDTRGYLRNRAASWTHSILSPSPVFQRHWRELMHTRQKRQDEQMFEPHVDTLEGKFHEIKAALEALRRRFYAPPQELAILRFVAEREIKEVSLYLEKVARPKLRIVALNPYLERDQEIALECELTNQSRSKVSDVELVLLNPGADFELLSDRAFSFVELSPNVPQRFTYRLRVLKSDEISFHFQYGYAGLQGHEDIEIRATVRTPENIPFRLLRNPFITGDIITDPEQFYGREAEMERLLRHLASSGRTNFLLQGARRMGKSSMLEMVEQAVKQPKLRRRFNIPADWDESFDPYITVKLSFQGFNPQEDASHISNFFRELVERATKVLAPSRCEQILNDFSAQLQTSDAQRAAEKALNHLLTEQPHRRALVLLDEYDELLKPKMADLDAPLRYVVQHVPSLTWIIATTRLLVERSKYYGSPWYNVLNQVRLGCLSREAARDLIIESSKRVGVEWRGDAIVHLLDETGRHPYLLQLFCSQVIDYLSAKGQNYVYPELIADLIDEIITESTTLHVYLEPSWGGDISGVGQLIMLISEWNETPLTKDRLREEVEKYLHKHFGPQVDATALGIEQEPRVWWELAWENGLAEVVEIRNTLQLDPDSRTYGFTVPIFRRWLQHKDHTEDIWMAVRHKISAELP